MDHMARAGSAPNQPIRLAVSQKVKGPSHGWKPSLPRLPVCRVRERERGAREREREGVTWSPTVDDGDDSYDISVSAIIITATIEKIKRNRSGGAE